jgi:hypothetical protein
MFMYVSKHYLFVFVPILDILSENHGNKYQTPFG